MKTKQNTSSGKRTIIAPSGIILFIVILFWIFGGQKSFAQGVGISEASIVPHSSSILELKSSLRGFLTPRMTTTERDAIPTPATGLLIYNTTTNAFNYYNAGWIAILNIGTGVTSISGTLNRISISGTPTVPIIDIDANYIGQTTINTLGTITTGTWNSTAIGIAYGGTGQTTAQLAINALAGGVTSGQYLRGNGTNVVMSAIQASDVPTLNQNTTGNAATATNLAGGSIGLIPYQSGANTTVLLPVGSAGQVLQSNGAAAPSWVTKNNGTVSTVSVISANGFAGTVATATTTPAITLTTSVTGLLKGNGAAISAATAGTDYSTGTSGLSTGILKSTTGTGALTIASAGTDYEVPLTFSTGLTRTTNTITVNTSQNISTLSNLTTNGLIRTSGGTGALSIATAGTDYENALTFTNGLTRTTNSVALGGTLTGITSVDNSTFALTLGGAASTGALTLGSSTAAQTVNIGTGTGASTVNIATGVTNAKIINIGTGVTPANIIYIGGANSTTNIGSVENTIGIAGTASGNGVRIGNGRVTINKPVPPITGIDYSFTATVQQILDAGIIGFNTSSNRTLTLPSAQGPTGLVQALPGTPAVGDVFTFEVFDIGGANVYLAAVFGTGITIVNTNFLRFDRTDTRVVYCRVTSVAAGAETINVY